MPKNTYRPLSRENNEELIVRVSTDFSGGLSLDTKTVEVPSPYVSALVNAKGYKDSIRGRNGTSKLCNGIEPVETYLYDSSYYDFEFIDGVLTINASPPGIHPTVYISDTVKITLFTGEVLVYKMTGYNGRHMSGRYKSINLMPDYDGRDFQTGEIEKVECFKRIHSTYYDFETDTTYLHIGNDFYKERGCKYTKILEYDLPDTRSTMLRIMEFVVLFTTDGIYSYKLVDGLNNKLTKMDVDGPANRLSKFYNNNDYAVYNYCYTYTTMATFADNRTDFSEDNYIVHESIPTTTMESDNDDNEAKKQYTRISAENDINPNGTMLSGLTELPEDYNTDGQRYALDLRIRKVHETDDPDDETTWDTYDIHLLLDFTDVFDMHGVARVISGQLKAYSKDFLVIYTNQIVFISSDFRDRITILPPETTPQGTPLVNITPGMIQGRSTEMINTVVTTFEYPSQYDSKPTHYSVYRSKNIYAHTKEPPLFTEPSIANKTDVLGWVADIPAIQFVHFTGDRTIGVDLSTIGSRGTYINSSGGASQDTIFGRYDPITGVAEIYQTGNYYTIDGGMFVFGTDSVGTIHTDTTPTIIDGEEYYKIYADEINGTSIIPAMLAWGPLFLEDGTIVSDVIHDYVNAYTKHKISTHKIFGYMPTERSMHDYISDISAAGYGSVWPLYTLGYRPLPPLRLVGINTGMLLGSSYETPTELEYSSTVDFRYLGYHNKAFQRISSINDKITAIGVTKTNLVFFTARKTYAINISQAKPIVNETLGTSYIVFPSPEMVEDSIGVVNDGCITNGPNMSMFVFTSEPGIRLFNGTKYSEDYSAGTIKKTIINNLNPRVTMAYNQKTGLLIWGEFIDGTKEQYTRRTTGQENLDFGLYSTP